MLPKEDNRFLEERYKEIEKLKAPFGWLENEGCPSWKNLLKRFHFQNFVFGKNLFLVEFKWGFSIWTAFFWRFCSCVFQNWFYFCCNYHQKKVPSAQTFFAPNRSKLGKWTIQNHCDQCSLNRIKLYRVSHENVLWSP